MQQGPDPRVVLVNALNAAIVEADQHQMPATSGLYTVVRDQTAANPFTQNDLEGLYRLVSEANQRAASMQRWMRRAKFAGAIAGVAYGLLVLAGQAAIFFHM